MQARAYCHIFFHNLSPPFPAPVLSLRQLYSANIFSSHNKHVKRLMMSTNSKSEVFRGFLMRTTISWISIISPLNLQYLKVGNCISFILLPYPKFCMHSSNIFLALIEYLLYSTPLLYRTDWNSFSKQVLLFLMLSEMEIQFSSGAHLRQTFLAWENFPNIGVLL